MDGLGERPPILGEEIEMADFTRSADEERIDVRLETASMRDSFNLEEVYEEEETNNRLDTPEGIQQYFAKATDDHGKLIPINDRLANSLKELAKIGYKNLKIEIRDPETKAGIGNSTMVKSKIVITGEKEDENGNRAPIEMEAFSQFKIEGLPKGEDSIKVVGSILDQFSFHAMAGIDESKLSNSIKEIKDQVSVYRKEIDKANNLAMKLFSKGKLEVKISQGKITFMDPTNHSEAVERDYGKPLLSISKQQIKDASKAVVNKSTTEGTTEMRVVQPEEETIVNLERRIVELDKSIKEEGRRSDIDQDKIDGLISQKLKAEILFAEKSIKSCETGIAQAKDKDNATLQEDWEKLKARYDEKIRRNQKQLDDLQNKKVETSPKSAESNAT